MTRPRKSDMAIAMLGAEDVDTEWPELEPLLAASCASNEVGAGDISPADIRAMALAGLCAVFAGRLQGELAFVLVLQFHTTNGRKGADVVAMGGQHLLRFKAAYWPVILDWLRANGCVFLDAYATERLAEVYRNKFGFDRSCVYMRMEL